MNIKIKNQSAAEIAYAGIGILTVPLSSGAGNATFLARYEVHKNASTYINIDGCDYAARLIDYMCHISANNGKKVPDSVMVTIDGTSTTDYTYTKISDTSAILKIHGEKVKGDITITASAVD